jgi:hypothetical protein
MPGNGNEAQTEMKHPFFDYWLEMLVAGLALALALVVWYFTR